MLASSIFTCKRVLITSQKQSQHGKRQLNLQYSFGLPFENKFMKVFVDYQTKTATVAAKNETLLSLTGKGSFEEVDFVNAAGECIGSGSYRELPNMSAESSAGLNRKYGVYKSNNQRPVARFHQVHQSNCLKGINLYIDQPELDNLTKTLLIGKLVMLALLDPGFLHFQPDLIDESQCITKIAADHILPNFILPDWDYPAQLRMRVIDTIMGEKDKRDYYILFDPFGKPWYIMETNSSTELKVLDPVTYQPLLIGDSAGSIDEPCTITTADKTVIGKLNKSLISVRFDDGFKNVYRIGLGKEPKRVFFKSLTDYRYQKNSVICKGEENISDGTELAINFYLAPHRLGLAVLPPVLCIFASQHYQMTNIQVPVSQSIEDLCLELKGVQV